MARGRKAIKPRGPMQRLIDNEAVSEAQSHVDVITPEQRAKGTYHGARGHLINNHDPVERWIAANRLTQSQQVVIQMCQRLWRLAGLTQRVTATYGEKTAPGISYELRAITEIEAREDLHRIQDYVPKPYWSCFENCCRHGLPAGTAGGLLGYGDRSAQDRAHQVVVFVADVIAMKERV